MKPAVSATASKDHFIWLTPSAQCKLRLPILRVRCISNIAILSQDVLSGSLAERRETGKKRARRTRSPERAETQYADTPRRTMRRCGVPPCWGKSKGQRRGFVALSFDHLISARGCFCAATSLVEAATAYQPRPAPPAAAKDPQLLHPRHRIFFSTCHNVGHCTFRFALPAHVAVCNATTWPCTARCAGRSSTYRRG
jgi:hypothetical protein